MANDPDVIATIVMMLISASSAVVSAFWLWRGVVWVRILIGSIAVVFAVGCGMVIWVRNWWGALGFIDALLVSGICVSVYTLYVFLKKRPN